MAWIEHPALDRAMAAERADRNYEKFQVRANEPGARLAEQQQFWKHEGSNPGGWNYSQIARPSGMNQWNVGSASSSIGLDDPENIERGWHTKTRDKYYDQMKGLNQFHREDMNRRLFLYPEMEEEYNFGYNSGGIASLENRPRYRWGGDLEHKPAVGLEPGIGSLMGYAKGGMVTKMKVKKGQSKWLKKFMNNMRDS